MPYGLFENELSSYFGQFGEVTRVKVIRSRKTARSKGYGFVEFASVDVARIATKSVSKLIIGGKTLEVKFVGPSTKTSFKKKSFVDWAKKFRETRNSEKSPADLSLHVKGLLQKEKEKREKLKERGIDYDFPGFVKLFHYSGSLSKEYS